MMGAMQPQSNAGRIRHALHLLGWDAPARIIAAQVGDVRQWNGKEFDLYPPTQQYISQVRCKFRPIIERRKIASDDSTPELERYRIAAGMP